jgi:hypothetical protein
MATTPQGNPLLNLTPSQVNRSESAQWRQIIKQALDDTRCASVAFLTEDMDAATQTVSVQIAIQERVRTAAGPAWMDVPTITKVPILVPRGGGFSLTLPLKKGDEGLLIFCDTCFDLWWTNGQASSPPPTLPAGVSASGSQRQNEVRRHYVHDCGFFPGMWSQPNVLSNYSTASAQLRSDDGSVSIDLAHSGITLTSPLVAMTGSLTVANGATGSFTTSTGQTVTVQDGVITNIY